MEQFNLKKIEISKNIEIEISGLDNIAKKLILKEDYPSALNYLNKEYSLLNEPFEKKLQDFKEWINSDFGKRARKVGEVMEKIIENKKEKNTEESSREDHLEAFYKCLGVSGSEASAEYISAQHTPTRADLNISKAKRLSELEESIRNYAKA